MARQVEPTIYAGTFIHNDSPTTLSYQHSTAVGVDQSGKIVFIEPYTDPTQDIPQIASKHNFASYKLVTTPSASSRSSTSRPPKKLRSFFFPGFIDTHTHASQYPNTGIFGSSTLLDWLNTYTFPLESSYRDVRTARRVYSRVVARSLAQGTTCAAYYATIHVPATNLLADICLARGQRALVGRVCMDRLSPPHYRDASPESAVADTQACIAHAAAIDPAGALVRPVITPRFAPSCSPLCLAALGGLARASGHFVQTHISENTAEVALVAELFPAAADYASVYDEAGLLGARTILAHAVHLTEAEVRLLAARGAKVAHCPVSNSCLTSGAARVKMLRERGVDVGLGTDMSGGFSPSILEMVRAALLVSRHVAMGEEGDAGDWHKLRVEEALWFGTRGGARVVGLEGAVGAFEVGMDWDAQMICLGVVDDGEDSSDGGGGGGGDESIDDAEFGPVDVFDLENWDDIVAKWVYCGDDRNIAAVWVKGRCVHDRRKVYGI